MAKKNGILALIDAFEIIYAISQWKTRRQLYIYIYFLTALKC